MMMPEYGMGVCCLQADSFIIIRNVLFPVNRTFRRKSVPLCGSTGTIARTDVKGGGWNANPCYGCGWQTAKQSL